MAKSGEKKLTYEQALDDLEQLIEDIESGEAGLEQTLASYEKGVKLITHCRAILERVEKRMAELKVQDQAGDAEPRDAANAVMEVDTNLDADLDEEWDDADEEDGRDAQEPNAHG